MQMRPSSIASLALIKRSRCISGTATLVVSLPRRLRLPPTRSSTTTSSSPTSLVRRSTRITRMTRCRTWQGADMELIGRGHWPKIVIVSVVVILSAIMGTAYTEAYNFHSPVNLTWHIGIPATLSIWAFRGVWKRCLSIFLLTVLSFLSAATFTHIYWGGF